MRKDTSKIKTYDYSFTTGKTKKTLEEDDKFFIDNNLDPTVVEFLQTNPFTYDIETTKVTVLSIEDFYIKFKKKELPLGSLVHNDKFKKRERKKYTKKAFKKWKKDYEERRNQSQLLGSSTVSSLLEFQYKRLNGFVVFFGFILLAISILCLLLFENRIIFDSSKVFLNETINILSNVYKKKIWKTITYLAVFFPSIQVVSTIVLSIYCSKMIRLNNKTKDLIVSSDKYFVKEFNKKYKKVRNYYIKKINRKEIYFPPYSIEDVCIKEVNFRNIEEVSNETIIRRDRFMKKWPPYRAMNKLFFIISSLLTAIIIGLIIYGLILNLLV